MEYGGETWLWQGEKKGKHQEFTQGPGGGGTRTETKAEGKTRKTALLSAQKQPQEEKE